MAEEDKDINTDRIIEGVFMASLLRKKFKTLLVNWAPKGVFIPLKCKKCGAVFVIPNQFGGKIKFGDDPAKCRQCNAMGHGAELLFPSMYLYAKGRWK